MWEKEQNSEIKQIPVSKKVNIRNNIYYNIQIMFSAAILLACFMLKGTNESTFIYAKENYQEFFENENFIENSFSYNMFIEKMYDELQIRFGQFIEVINNFSGKGKADIYPSNVSSDSIRIETKGIVPAMGYISSPYGIRTNPFNSKEKEFHTGMDIAAPKGTYIKASFGGTVISVGNSNTAGNYIRITSENGIETLYAHNQFNLVRTGDKVLQGQVIATIGDTGLATGPHIHFEFIVDSIRYNPVYGIQI